VRRKGRPSAPQLREELAEAAELMAGQVEAVSAEAAEGYRARAARIRDGGEVRCAGWQVPDWARGAFGMYDRLVLGADDILRPDLL